LRTLCSTYNTAHNLTLVVNIINPVAATGGVRPAVYYIWPGDKLLKV